MAEKHWVSEENLQAYHTKVVGSKTDKTADPNGTIYQRLNAQKETIGHLLILKITFSEEFKGKAYTVTGNGETFTGTVPNSLYINLYVHGLDTIYTVSAEYEGETYTSEVETKDFYGVYFGELNTFTVTASGASRANSFIYEYDLGTSFTNDQSADIIAGTFDKVRPGGYWTINGRKYWAAHADYRLHCGDTELTKHHMLVFPDKSFYTHYMNSTNVTTGAYYGSNMVSDGLTQALATVKADFGESHVLTYRNLLANAVSGDSSSNWAWYDRQIDLMNECMVYGHQAWGAAAHDGYDAGCDKSQLALFQARPDLITNRETWWLRDVQSSAGFCYVSPYGNASYWSASNVGGVRPAFLIA